LAQADSAFTVLIASTLSSYRLLYTQQLRKLDQFEENFFGTTSTGSLIRFIDHLGHRRSFVLGFGTSARYAPPANMAFVTLQTLASAWPRILNSRKGTDAQYIRSLPSSNASGRLLASTRCTQKVRVWVQPTLCRIRATVRDSGAIHNNQGLVMKDRARSCRWQAPRRSHLPPPCGTVPIMMLLRHLPELLGSRRVVISKVINFLLNLDNPVDSSC
jgi:hypothetical protein